MLWSSSLRIPLRKTESRRLTARIVSLKSRVSAIFTCHQSRITILWLAGGDDFVVGFAAGQAAFFCGEFEGFFAVEFGLVDQFFDALGEALHGIGGSAGVSGIFRADEQRDFSFCGSFLERGEKFGEFAAAKLFVELGDFAGDASGAVAENFAGVGDAFRDAVRGFIENDGAILDAQALEGAAAFAGARGEKANEEKFFVGQAACGERSEKRRWSGHGNDRDMMTQAKRDETMPRIRNQRHAGVAH